jgi:hypothetical protein
MLKMQSLQPWHRRIFILQEAAMLFGFNLNDLFVFPFQDSESRKHFFIGCLIYLAGFVIPILPWLVATGYVAILIRQVLNGEKPHLVPWQDWERLLKDGARLFGVRLVYASPLLLVMIPLFLIFFSFPFFPILFQHTDSHSVGTIYLLLVFASTGIFFLIMPLSLAIGLIVPAAEVHMIAKDDFAAGFQVKEWWAIFKRNWGGFVVALAILYALTMVLSIVMQIMFITFVLICLFPLLLPVVSMYSAVVQYVAFAQAYKDGKDRLALEAIHS